ncbi:hypothetical protein BLA29_013208, partial [Euroglyphus maynei]
MTNNANYEVLTEKFCFRLPSNGHHSSSSSNRSQMVNRALFLDVLSKRTPQNLSSTHGHHHHHLFHHQHSSQHSDASNYYLIIQVWRFGRTLTNDNGRNSVGKSTTGQSVFHTISSASSIGSSAAAVASNSLSSLTSFVSNSFS